MTHSLSLLPNTLIPQISSYLDSKTKRSLSMVDRRIHAVILDTVRSIRVFPPRCFLFHRAPKDILIKVIGRYRNVETIIFGPLNKWDRSSHFGAKEVQYLKSLISYLESNREIHPLSSVKKIQYREIAHNNFTVFDEIQAKKLNTRFLHSIGHPGLENIRIHTNQAGPIPRVIEIQPVLNNSPNLKTFVFHGFTPVRITYLSFARQSQLSKVQLLHWAGPASTIESLRQCKKLKELVIDYTIKA